MSIKKTLLATLTTTTFLTAGVALAANDQTAAPRITAQQQKTLDKDVGKLSADGSRGFNDIALTRLAVFDGRTDDAKKFINEADTELAKSKTDETVFTKAESDFKSSDKTGPSAAEPAASAAPTDKTASNPSSADHMAANGYADNAKKDGMNTPKQWLPVDGEISLNEDFTAQPAKAAAVADANQTLAKGDRKGAMEKLKFAGIDVDYVMAVVPLDQTIRDVHQAATLVNGGKYYEASQLLRQVQDSTRYDMLDVSAVPKASAAAKTPASGDTPKTH